MPDMMDRALPVMLDTPAMEDNGQPAMPDTEALSGMMTAAEAAQALGVSERTVRRWVTAGELSGTRVRGPHGPELRIDRGAVAAYRMIQAPAVDKPDTPAMPDTRRQAMTGTPDSKPDMTGNLDNGQPVMPDTFSVVQVLQARLDGAQLAAKLHAKRMWDAKRQAEEERHRLIAAEEKAREQAAADALEIEFLRQQLQQRTDAERELRFLLAQTTQALQMATEKPALAAPPPDTQTETPKRARWWWFRRRTE